MAVAHGRAALLNLGVKWSKLTEGQVREVWALLAAGESGASLARRFGVSQNAISSIRNGWTWTEITGATPRPRRGPRPRPAPPPPRQPAPGEHAHRWVIPPLAPGAVALEGRCACGVARVFSDTRNDVPPDDERARVKRERAQRAGRAASQATARKAAERARA